MRVRLNNVGVIDKCDVEFIPGINLIVGSSGSGKSTLMRSIYNIVTNEFSDSDISFGKNTMNIRIDYNNNFVEYSRSLKAKGERCYYIVNNNQYVKLGRQPLQAVTDVLSISDIDINNENINFNFNLQFSSPFLILGSQSTLYNVLTYRSTFDISSINDLYSADVKNNSNEISANYKLKENLENRLDNLDDQAESLSGIEKLYSDYMSYKHRLEVKEDIQSLYTKSNDLLLINSNVDLLDAAVSHCNKSNELVIKLKEFSKFNKTKISLRDTNSKIKSLNSILLKIDAAIKTIEDLINVNNIKDIMKRYNNIIYNLSIVNNISCTKIANDNVINDIVKQRSLLYSYNKCDKITSIMGSYDSNIINVVSDLIILDDKLDYLDNVNKESSKIDSLYSKNKKEICKFKVCPLCGRSIDDANHSE